MKGIGLLLTVIGALCVGAGLYCVAFLPQGPGQPIWHAYVPNSLVGLGGVVLVPGLALLARRKDGRGFEVKLITGETPLERGDHQAKGPIGNVEGDQSR